MSEYLFLILAVYAVGEGCMNVQENGVNGRWTMQMEMDVEVMRTDIGVNERARLWDMGWLGADSYACCINEKKRAVRRLLASRSAGR